MGSLLLASAGDRRRTIIRFLLLPRSLLLLQSLLFAFLLEYFAGISAGFWGRETIFSNTLFCPQISEERVNNMHNSTTTLGEVFCIYYNPERLFLAAQFDALSLFFTSRRRR